MQMLSAQLRHDAPPHGSIEFSINPFLHMESKRNRRKAQEKWQQTAPYRGSSCRTQTFPRLVPWLVNLPLEQ